MDAPLPFGEWLPDSPNLENQLVTARNVYAARGGYGPFEGANGTGDSTTETVQGSKLFVRDDGTPLVIAGSSTRLIVRDSGGVTETSGFAALDVNDNWEFERFNDYIIAVSINNDTQYLTDLDTDTSFSALPGSPPKAGVAARILDFLVLGDLVDIDASTRPYRVRWGAQNNPTANWVDDMGNLSGSYDLPREYGRITGIVSGTSGIVFQERAVWRIDFVGAPQVFDFVPIATDKGCAGKGSIVNVGTNTFFLSQDGFNVTNGSSVERVSGSRTTDWFNKNNTSSLVKVVQGAVNWPKRAIVWSFAPTSGPRYSQQIIFAMDENKWTHSTTQVDNFVQTKADAMTLADLAVSFPSGLTFGAIGNPEFLSKDFVLGAWVPSGSGSEFSTMNGPVLEAEIVTGDKQPVPGMRIHINGAMPLIENDSMNTTLQILGRDTQSGPQRAGTATSEGADGYCPAKMDTRFGAVSMVVPAGAVWDNAQGVMARYTRTGAR